MDRAIRLLVGAVLVQTSSACSSVVQPGLANAPTLGTTSTAEARVTDVIANGLDSCGRELDPGPLRHRIPKCPTVTERATPISFRFVLPPGSTGDDVVQPWLEHYYSGWPCSHGGGLSDGERLVAWSPTDLGASRCAMP
jgi:hypothetical protein